MIGECVRTPRVHTSVYRDAFVESDFGTDVLISIPFTASIKLKALRIAGDKGPLHPKSVRLYKDRPMVSNSRVVCARTHV